MIAVAGLGLFIIFTALAAFSFVINGWVLSILWAWYVAPLGVPALSIPMAIGITLVVAMLTRQDDRETPKDPDKTPRERMACALGNLAVRPFIYLVLGWLVLKFL